MTTAHIDYTNDLLAQLEEILAPIIAPTIAPIIVPEELTNPLVLQLAQYIDSVEQNGIKQHSDKWKLVRKLGVGGSQIASIMGCNPYGTLRELLYSKTELVRFESNEKMQWGNLFEELIKLYVERDKQITILGEDIFIDTIETNGLYYSPDGLAIYDDKITLFEFKCPFSRIPNKQVPISYVPQMKMGMEIISITPQSLYAEAVFRYCSVEQMGFGKAFNKGMGQKGTGKKVLATGFIGLTVCAENLFHPAVVAFINSPYYINATKNASDFGAQDSIILLLSLTDTMNSSGSQLIVDREYVMRTCAGSTTSAQECAIADELVAQLKHSRATAKLHNKMFLGILPWKLLRIDYHTIEKDTGYLTRADREISEFIGIVRDCYQKPDAEKKRIIDYYIDGAPKLNASGHAIDLANDVCDLSAFM